MEKRAKKKKRILYLGILLFIVALFFISQKLLSYHLVIQKESNLIEEYFKSQKQHSNLKKDSYIAILEIPKIKIKRGLFAIHNKNNTVDKTIQIITPSDMPDIENGNLTLAAHSGTGRIAFFKNLNKLQIGDEIILYFNQTKYTYKVRNIYEEKKDGDIEIRKNPNTTTLTLTTCKPKEKDKQLILISEQTKKEKS